MSTTVDQPGGHPATPVLSRYVAEVATDIEAWSVEAHVLSCRRCAAYIAAATSESPVTDSLATSKAAVLSRLAPTAAVPGTSVADGVGSPAELVYRPAHLADRANRPPYLPAHLADRADHPAYRSLTMLTRVSRGRVPWLVAVLVVAVSTVVVDLVWRQYAMTTTWQIDSLALLIGPVLPLVGVAFVYSASADPCAEVVRSSPSAGVRMVLWRTLAVLAVAVPVATLLGVSSGAVTAGALLLPTLALTTATLALGVRTGLEVAAAVVAGVWTVVLILPSVALTKIAWPVYSEPAMWWWVAALLVSSVAIAGSQDGFERIAVAGHRRGKMSW